MLLVPGDMVALHQRQEILRRIARQCRSAEMRVLGEEIGGAGADIGEIAAAPARNADFLRQALGMVDQHHAQTALASDRGTHHASGAGAEHCYIEHQSSIRQST